MDTSKINLILFLFVSGFITACTSKMHINKPSFNVVIKDAQHEINLSKKSYEVFLTSGNKKVNFEIQDNDLRVIIDFVEKNPFFLKKKNNNWYSFTRTLPVSETEIIISNNGNNYITSYCSPCCYPFNYRKAQKTESLIALIEGLCQMDEEVKRLPPSDFYME